jgi:hypothetical protein
MTKGWDVVVEAKLYFVSLSEESFLNTFYPPREALRLSNKAHFRASYQIHNISLETGTKSDSRDIAGSATQGYRFPDLNPETI